MRRKLTTEEFKKKGKELFGNRFDYSESVYVTAHTKIKISCRKHGELTNNLTPNKHLRRDGGCKKCQTEKASQRLRMSLVSFLESAKQVHGDEYDYSLVKSFKNQQEQIKIKHKDCGNVFSMTVNKHLMGQGCSYRECVSKKISESNLKTTKDFIEEAIAIHGLEHYDYSNTKYLGAHTKVDIFCNFCQKEFSQTPTAHTSQKQGCATCGEQLRQLGDYLHILKQKGNYIDGVLYLIECFNDEEYFYKIGITKTTAKTRFVPSKMPYDYEVLFELPIGYIRAFEHEQAILDKLASYRYYPKIIFGGNTECLSVNPVEYDIELFELVKTYSQQS